MMIPLDPQTARFVEAYYALNLPPRETIPIADLRRFFDERMYYPSKAPIQETKDLKANGVPVRIYIPKGKGPHPVLIYFHGGGWVVGSSHSHDAFLRETCSRAECIVVSVDYPLAPEHKFPKPLEGCFKATEWTFAHIADFGGDPTRIVIGGDSSGGNLAAAVTLKAKMEKKKLHFAAQLLIYPALNHNFDTHSYHAFAEGFIIDRKAMQWYWDCYLLQSSDGKNPLASPLQAPDLTGLPPTLFLIAEYDVLRDEGLAYAARLKAAGVPTFVRTYNSIHGFLAFSNQLDIGQQGLHDVASLFKPTE